MRLASVRRFGALAGFLSAAILICGVVAAPASAEVTSGDWGTSDGGAVSVKPNGSCEVAFSDASNGKSVYASGRIVNRQTTPDGKTELTCKPRAGGGTLYIIVVGADGLGELDVVEGGARHKGADLTK
jgi:hypothetical protein